jgi:hypothetical protein
MKIKKVTNEELRQMMKNGKVTFQYKKNDGTIRQAVGTLKSDLITTKPMGGVCYPKAAGYSPYFDVEKDGFRVYAESKLIGVVEA